MSIVLIRAALETALLAMSPALATVPENGSYKPVVDTPYQQVHLLAAPPSDDEVGANLYTERGYMQVSLYYPLDAGPGAAAARAELIRSTFYRGLALTSGGINVVIERTPEIAPARTEADRYVLPVRVRFYAHVVRS